MSLFPVRDQTGHEVSGARYMRRLSDELGVTQSDLHSNRVMSPTLMKYTSDGVPKNWDGKDWQTYKCAMINVFK